MPNPRPSPNPQTQTQNGQLTRQNRSNELMPPPPPPKRIKRPSTVLDEDVYTTALSDIIARDFFPGVAEARAEESELSWATGQGLRQGKGSGSRSRFGERRRRQADETPAGWGGETPVTVATAEQEEEEEEEADDDDDASEAGTDVKTQPPDISGMSLLAFQAKYTSEDNESFNKLLDRQNTTRRKKYAWLWAQNHKKSDGSHQNRLTGPDTAQKRLTEKGEGEREDGEGEGEGEGGGKLIKTNLDARPANPTTWNAPPENSLMFMPDSVEDTHETIAQRAELESRMGPKRVLYHNTRLPDKSPPSQRPPPQSPSLSAIQDAIAGNPRLSASEAGSAVYTGGETPRVNGYAFVDDEDDSYGQTTPNPFTIPQNRRREDLHHRMVDSMSRSKRAERSSGSGSRSTSGKPLTPAAQKLLKRVGNTPRTEVRGSGNMWTPTPKTNNSNRWTPTPRRR